MHNIYKGLLLYTSMEEGYPVLNEDIYFAKMNTHAGVVIKVHNVVTQKDYRVNAATAAFLELCTGTHTLSDITETLSQRVDEPREEVEYEVKRVAAVLQKKGIIAIEETPLEKGRKTVKNVNVLYPPYSAHVEITNRCNLRCMHCANNSGDPYPDELTTKEILSLIDSLSRMGVTRIVLTGGEPLLHPDLYAIINHARKAPMTVDIFTNATLITKEHVKKLKKSGVRKISTSIDSIDESVHDTFRGKKGALKKTLKGISLLQKVGFPVRISISVSQLNKDHIVDILKYLGELHLTDYQIVPVKYSGRGVTDIVISPEEYYAVLVDEYTYLKKERPRNIHGPPQETDGCGIGEDGIYIKADGTVLPCRGCHIKMSAGNVRDGLVELWNNNETLEMVRKMKTEDDSVCAECQYLSVCDGCIADAFIFEGSFRFYNPYTCVGQKAYNDVFGT